MKLVADNYLYSTLLYLGQVGAAKHRCFEKNFFQQVPRRVIPSNVFSAAVWSAISTNLPKNTEGYLARKENSYAAIIT